MCVIVLQTQHGLRRPAGTSPANAIQVDAAGTGNDPAHIDIDGADEADGADGADGAGSTGSARPPMFRFELQLLDYVRELVKMQPQNRILSTRLFGMLYGHASFVHDHVKRLLATCGGPASYISSRLSNEGFVFIGQGEYKMLCFYPPATCLHSTDIIKTEAYPNIPPPPPHQPLPPTVALAPSMHPLVCRHSHAAAFNSMTMQMPAHLPLQLSSTATRQHIPSPPPEQRRSVLGPLPVTNSDPNKETESYKNKPGFTKDGLKKPSTVMSLNDAKPHHLQQYLTTALANRVWDERVQHGNFSTWDNLVVRVVGLGTLKVRQSCGACVGVVLSTRSRALYMFITTALLV